MNATQPTTARKVARSARRKPHRALPGITLIAALAVAFGLAASGCDSERSVASPTTTGERSALTDVAAFTIGDLPAGLELTADQRQSLTGAIDELNRSREELRDRFGPGAGRDGAHHGRRGLRGRLHRGADRGAGLGANFEPPIIGFLEKASTILDSSQFVVLAQFLAEHRDEMRPHAAELAQPFEGPFGRMAARRLGLTEAQQSQLQPLITAYGEGMRQVHDGIEAGTMTPEQARDRATELRRTLEQGAKEILTAEQWQQVQNFRERRLERRTDRLDDRMPEHVDRVTGMYIRVLGLDGTQASAARQIMQQTIPARRALLDRREAGNIEPEDFVYEMMTLEKNAVSQVRATLTPDQAARFDALVSLLPRGIQPMGGFGGPMGGPGGPQGRPGGGFGRGSRR